MATVGGSLKDEFSIPGSETQKATNLIDAEFAAEQGGVLNIVFAAPEGERLDEPPARKAAILAAIAKLRTSEFATIGPDERAGVESVGDPFSENTFSEDGRIAYAEAQFVPVDVGLSISSNRATRTCMSPPYRRSRRDCPGTRPFQSIGKHGHHDSRIAPDEHGSGDRLRAEAVARFVEGGVERIGAPVLGERELDPVCVLEVRQGDADECDTLRGDQWGRAREEAASRLEDRLLTDRSIATS